MFKKRPNIPPRPKPPVGDQILEDIKNAPEDDDVFILMKNTTEFLPNIQDTAVNADDSNSPEAVYQKVRNYLEVNRNLESVMKTLEEQTNVLLSSEVEIKNMAKDIRKQAMDAVK
ncbi:hypothetical protein L9F63_024023 [Diploptera punctata]|uniref:Uncharacterized protein n=1 Tax=Diploptera punctata TaxID=6984 RepID=A0AAD7ZI77_DIPPU|nr:hypothetical protein L9F63_024023 [Diploptera punctata]